MPQKKGNRLLWTFPWNYSESFIIAIGLGVISIIIQLVTATNCPKPSFPNNIIILFAIIFLLISLKLMYPKNGFIVWLSSIPATIAAISYFGMASILMGLIVQNNQAQPDNILNNIANSWFYFFSVIMFTFVLGMTVLKRLIPFKYNNIGFIINHLGLWLIIVGGSLGAGDFTEFKMTGVKGETVWQGIDYNYKVIEPGIAIELQNFNIEYFSPELQLWDVQKNSILPKIKPAYIDTNTNEIKLGPYKIIVNQFYKRSFLMDNRFRPFYGPGSVPSAHISVINTVDSISGWVNPPNEIHNAAFLKINDKHAIVLQYPKPSKYSSTVKVYSESGKIKEGIIEVNKPMTIDNWNIYQVSYDTQMGKWSEISIFEVNKDPWLPVVYTGIFMLIAGSLWLFKRGANFKKDEL